VRKNVQRHGFTLIELAAVIAVVAIVAALLLPCLSRTMAATDAAVCKGNLRQSTIAVNMYVTDHQTYPLGQQYFHYLIGPYLNLPRFDSWQAAVVGEPNAYIGGPDLRRTVLNCPSFCRLPNAYTFAFGYNWGGVSGTSPGRSGRFHLGLGGEILSRSQASTNKGLPTSMRAIKDSEVIRPGNMIALGDSIAVSFAQGPHSITGGFSDLSMAVVNGATLLKEPAYTETWKKRHKDRFNVTFCDGHVETLKSRTIADNENAEHRRRWNNDSQPHFEISGHKNR
jgi:prepilin-type N-terminal cleavage/methylation domain-containing protein/prepilin-type processing-associated H-X9-DG protein